jgi:hypothetical protein
MRATQRGIECENALFVGAQSGRFTKYPMRTYDDGYGPLWLYRESLGPLGIVRAETWEDAWSCVEDEILDDADPDLWDEDERAAATANEPPEGCGYRPSGSGDHSWNQTGIYQQDLNGNSLDLLTPELMEEYGIVITWEER